MRNFRARLLAAAIIAPAFVFVLESLDLSTRAASPIKVMILDGESGGPYHKWQLVSPVLKKELEETGLFQIDVVTAPKWGGDFSGFKPDFSQYQAVVSNYDAPDWPAEIKSKFDEYMKNGGGLVTVHAADNSFGQWTEYNEMIGVGGWRDRTEASGPLWFFKEGKLVSDSSPGRAGGHGARVPFKITMRNSDHPITRGLPREWMHQGDALQHASRPRPAHDGTGNRLLRSCKPRHRTR